MTNDPILKGKHIVLGISGGIAAYKSILLARLFIKAGAEVQVVITPNGKEFVTPLTLSTITSKPVVSEFFDRRDGSWNSHVDLGLWADAMVIAPATASTIGKMANGIADNMLITTYLSAKAPVFIAPAMDLDMYRHPTTARNLQTLQSFGNIIIEAADGELASHLVGKGRMQEPEIIFRTIRDFFDKNSTKSKILSGKKAVITAGPTYEEIDPVRFIGNHSTGRMGIEIADELARLGAEVELVLGPSELRPKEKGVRLHPVKSALQMLEEARTYFADADIAVMSAAVADYRPKSTSSDKIKREKTREMTIELVANPDIAATLGKTKKPGQFMVGFALETARDATDEAKRKIVSKNLDAVVLNTLADKGAGFGGTTNKVTIIERDGTMHPFPLKSKSEVAADIAGFISGRIVR